MRIWVVWVWVESPGGLEDWECCFCIMEVWRFAIWDVRDVGGGGVSGCWESLLGGPWARSSGIGDLVKYMEGVRSWQWLRELRGRWA